MVPLKITRISENCYRVGRVHIKRGFWRSGPSCWAAVLDNDPEGPPLFIQPTLEKALDMAAGAIEMLRPASGYCQHYKPESTCPTCEREEMYR